MTELHFKGKEFVHNHHLAVLFRPLIPDVEIWRRVFHREHGMAEENVTRSAEAFGFQT